MKHYLLSIYQPDGPPPPPEFLEPIMQKVNALTAEMKGAGAWVFGGGLHGPDTATVVRANGNDVLMTDGPYIEGKEHIGGFTVVKAPDLDAALEWARKLATIIAPLAIAPGPVAALNRAVALAEVRGPLPALREVERLRFLERRREELRG